MRARRNVGRKVTLVALLVREVGRLERKPPVTLALVGTFLRERDVGLRRRRDALAVFGGVVGIMCALHMQDDVSDVLRRRYAL